MRTGNRTKNVNALGVGALLLSVAAFAAPGGAVPPGAGGKPRAGQGVTVSGSTVTCSPASRTDAGCVAGGAQQFPNGVKTMDALILDGGVPYGLKVRTAVCLASTNTNLGDTTACQGASFNAPSSGQLDINGTHLAINATGIYPLGAVNLGGGTEQLALYNGSYARFVGVATGSLPACAGGTRGAVQYDTTTQVLKWCGGGGWTAPLKTSTALSGVCFGSPCSGESANFTGAVDGIDGDAVSLTCSWNAAGTGGATGVVVRVREQSGPATLCSCTVGACTTAANTPLSCACTGTMESARQYAFQLDPGTDCSANPGQIVCQLAVSGR